MSDDYLLRFEACTLWKSDLSYIVGKIKPCGGNFIALWEGGFSKMFFTFEEGVEWLKSCDRSPIANARD